MATFMFMYVLTCFVVDCSLFTWNNDTVNIWSHLIGFLIFLILLIWDNIISFPTLHCSFMDQFVASVGLCCYQV